MIQFLFPVALVAKPTKEAAFSTDFLSEVVRKAAEHQRPVAAHAHGAKGVIAAVQVRGGHQWVP